MVTVYRMEDAAGHGPYGWTKPSGLPDRLFIPGGPLECECEKHPGPIMSKAYPGARLRPDIRPHELRYGFDTKADFHRWWDARANAALEQYQPGRYGMATYLVPSIEDKDPHQVCWRGPEAQRLSWKPCTQLATRRARAPSAATAGELHLSLERDGNVHP